ncbi:MAG: ribonuclease P protein component [Candidatus Jacksonbacteria bacterium RIFOXYA2_FULL_44_7]|uniref:Ribonuclease P protein component n=1 Tax=Candidatus Jacksonbacteria bacterium RIFCSPLOWO2_02_FULL_44_20 TaxID=1798460 RepID=A0A1G2A8J3_9BACT|nr:MAG: Ribonuclease P protein component [Parcubacteria group bacterium GW2011_GWC2_44_17]KKT49349.1 MAG: Ribonuclease P protein component [Parcubacteria group bacterium GW2011_GWF2_44_17]OGY69915.1 MAG: ribonuclease P protein component [Candidatus Jacksonbacteria bacterium RIFCSPHIGHO2_02_FULL_44_25]OGY70185.1 MAG: ribonuclease P protein component [Candidatus Jacksonbacteria bacterium RIFCSPHIGHO2_12_FULL_44_12]OGY72397.1 MAG: ribonuclease P protein component [Candidatus Jacksonbacteria bacter
MLPKPNRLSEEYDFRRVIAKGRAFFIRECGIKILRNYKNQPTRIGIVVPKKITKTIVKRNKIKRQARHIFLKFLPFLAQGYDIVLLVRESFIDLEFEEKEKKIGYLLTKTKILARQ